MIGLLPRVFLVLINILDVVPLVRPPSQIGILMSIEGSIYLQLDLLAVDVVRVPPVWKRQHLLTNCLAGAGVYSDGYLNSSKVFKTIPRSIELPR